MEPPEDTDEERTWDITNSLNEYMEQNLAFNYGILKPKMLRKRF